MADVPKTWPLNGHAPGDYECKCVSCKQHFLGDKRAYQCLDCAVRQLQSLLSTLLSERERRTPAVVTWQPIETAPLDEMLLLCDVTWPIGQTPPVKIGYWRDTYWHIFGASWLPTHWQPLPAAPSLSTSAGGEE